MKANGPWWYTYRRQKYKPKNSLTLEMIIRKSLRETVTEYLEHSSIAGVHHICDATTVKLRLLWITVFGVCSAAVCYFLFYTWTGTLSKPLLVSLESLTYPISQMDFPAVALCNVNRISRKVLEKHLETTYAKAKRDGRNITMDDIKAYFLDMERLLDFGYQYNRTYVKSLDTMLALESYVGGINPNINDLMKETSDAHGDEMAPACDEMLIKCIWSGTFKDCKSIFSVRRTINGHCCVFNYVLDYDSADNPGQILGAPLRQVAPGPANGLSMVIDPLLFDYAHDTVTKSGFDVFVFDPTIFPDPNGGHVVHHMVKPNEMQILRLRSEKQVASAEVRKYSTKTRKCLFRDELQSEFHNMYSYSACLVKCKMESVQSLCKCLPYFYPSYKIDGRTCGIRDLKCLYKYVDKFLYLYPMDTDDTSGLETELVESLYCPHCLPDCEATKYQATSFKLFDNAGTKRFKNGLLKEINLTSKCVVNIHQSSATGSIFRLDVVAYWFEILSNFGGFAGILLGLGGFTIIEQTYFILIRLVQLTMWNYIRCY